MRTRTFLVLAVLLASAHLSWAQQSVRGAAERWGSLHMAIIDGETGRLVPARCYLTDSTRQFWSPVGAINYVEPPERHFITSGEFRIGLPPRAYTLTVERGPEYRPVKREIEIRSGEERDEKIELPRWINMNARGWYSGDLHNHRAWQEMPQLLLAEDLNLAPTLTEWIWEDRPISRAPTSKPLGKAIQVVDATHAFSVFDTEIERLREGPGAVDLLGLRWPVSFQGYRLFPPSSIFAEQAHRQGGYVDAEKITWRDVAALVALGHIDFAGIVHNHFNRHGVDTETAPWGMIPKEKPEYESPEGLALWTMEVYYKFLNCGFKLPVSAGSASGVKASPLGCNRVYVYLDGDFGYEAWFRALKAGRSFATNGPMLFLEADGHGPGSTIRVPAAAGRPSRVLTVGAEASTAGELDRLEILWKGQVVKSVKVVERQSSLSVTVEMRPRETGWLVARAFEKLGGTVKFAHTSPIYVVSGRDPGIVPEDAKFLLSWIEREANFYRDCSGFRSAGDREAMLSLFREARRVYYRLAFSEARGRPEGVPAPGRTPR